MASTARTTTIKKATTATKAKTPVKKETLDYEKEITSLKKVMSDYKIERKADWKIFKKNMNENIDKLEKSLDSSSKKNKK